MEFIGLPHQSQRNPYRNNYNKKLDKSLYIARVFVPYVLRVHGMLANQQAEEGKQAFMTKFSQQAASAKNSKTATNLQLSADHRRLYSCHSDGNAFSWFTFHKISPDSHEFS
jgi:hypothetical protein